MFAMTIANMKCPLSLIILNHFLDYRLLIRAEIVKFRALYVGEVIERRTTHIFKFILKLAKELYHQGIRLNELNRITSAAERYTLNKFIVKNFGQKICMNKTFSSLLMHNVSTVCSALHS